MFGGLLGYAIGNITTGTLARWMYVFVSVQRCPSIFTFPNYLPVATLKQHAIVNSAADNLRCHLNRLGRCLPDDPP